MGRLLHGAMVAGFIPNTDAMVARLRVVRLRYQELCPMFGATTLSKEENMR